MSSDPPVAHRTIAVIGATGYQGGGVVRALLKATSDSGPWLVRAISQNPSSPKAQRLLAENQTPDERLTIVAANVYDVASLHGAFAGAHGVFAITHDSHPTKVIAEDQDMLHEIEAGRNMVFAAKACGVKHFVFSTLPDMVKATGGRFTKIHHMNNKYAIETIARKELNGYTGIIPADGIVRFCPPVPGHQVTQWTDPAHDVGVFAEKVYFISKGIFALGVEETRGKIYLALSQPIRSEDIAKIFTRVTGQPSIYYPISLEEYGDFAASMIGPGFKEDIMQMMEWVATAPQNKICYGSMDPDDRSAEELGVKASTFEEWLRRSWWKGPEEAYQKK
ncbi:NAD(P)-binding protein [Periconia macrospinosa]|uniref:NAD(P)-binding protein n=1 Tax=Periconia macrospinosa TaxID=97972 RepID=A0A2V1E8Z5_9PLEO|nr:NAD(P)-binding protein [Periconia macrospinosa]